ncbi:MAG: ammonium transporter [Haliangiales bacterium]
MYRLEHLLFDDAPERRRQIGRRPRHTGRAGALAALALLTAALTTLLLAPPALAQTSEVAAEAAAAEPLTWEQFRDHHGLDTRSDLHATPLSDQGGGFPVDFLWIIIASILVFWMQAGFAMVEAGFTRAKNVVNILMKNVVDFSLGAIVFWALGFGLMFGASNSLFGTTDFFMSGVQEPWSYAFLLFQTVFAATAATIVSGAMAERIRFRAYLFYTVVITGLIYPVFGSWAWGGLFNGGGWLEAPAGGVLAKVGLPGFIDFAGSTVVHSVGGWVALAGVLVIGPRIGKHSDDGTVNPIFGHNMPFAALGVMILWMGWFGFNAGSTTGVTGGGDDLFGGAGKSLALIAINTNLSAAAGAVVAMLVSWRFEGKPDVGITLNGALAGLVAITAPCATVTPVSAVVIGAIAGGLVFASVLFFDKNHIDDPVGAISVHGVCGAWGTLAAAIFHVGGFSVTQLAAQAIGVLAAFAWSFSSAFVLFKALDKFLGMRVTPEEELEGLDIVCHGASAYPDDIYGGGVANDPPAGSAYVP